MSELLFSRDVHCPAQRCRSLLLDPDFLAAFLDLQEPLKPSITVSSMERSSALGWTVRTEGIPAGLSRLLPVEVAVILVIVVPEATGAPGTVSVDLPNKPTGRLRAALQLTARTEDPGRTFLTVRGSFTIDLGLLSGRVSNYLRGELIVPMLDELADLLEQWSAPAAA